MSITAIVLNHQKILPTKTLKSLQFLDEVILLQDKDLVDIPVDPKLRVINRKLSGNFSAHRNFALQQARSDWVLFVDSDEVVSKKLQAEITHATKSINTAGYYLPRVDFYYSQKLKHGETGSCKILRLARKGTGTFSRAVHERWQIKGNIQSLASPLLHYKDTLTTGFISRMVIYGPPDARSLSAEGKSFSPLLLFFPLGKFLQNYLVRLGFLDGYLGLFHAYLMSVQSMSTRVYQWQLKN